MEGGYNNNGTIFLYSFNAFLIISNYSELDL